MAYLGLRQQQSKGQHVRIPVLIPNSLRFALINKHLQCKELPANHADCYAAIDLIGSTWRPLIISGREENPSSIFIFNPPPPPPPHSYSSVLTEQIKKFGVHFRTSLWEIKRGRTATVWLTLTTGSVCVEQQTVQPNQPGRKPGASIVLSESDCAHSVPYSAALVYMSWTRVLQYVQACKSVKYVWRIYTHLLPSTTVCFQSVTNWGVNCVDHMLSCAALKNLK